MADTTDWLSSDSENEEAEYLHLEYESSDFEFNDDQQVHHAANQSTLGLEPYQFEPTIESMPSEEQQSQEEQALHRSSHASDGNSGVGISSDNL